MAITFGLRAILLGMFIFATAPALLRAQAEAWTQSHAALRREVVLPSRTVARTNVPVFVNLADWGHVDLASVRVEEVAPSGTATPIDAAAYAHETGFGGRAYWAAPGATPAHTTRRFLLYYNLLPSRAQYTYQWNRSGQTFGGSGSIQADGLSKGTYILRGDLMELQRKSRHQLAGDMDLQNMAWYEKNPNGNDFNHLTNLSSGLSPIDGLRLTWGLFGPQHDLGFDMTLSDGNARRFDRVIFDRNGPTGMMSAHYTVQDIDPAHTISTTYRLFKGQPFMEFSWSQATLAGQSLPIPDDVYHARQFYLKSGFTPTGMLMDQSNDSAVSTNDHPKHYQILYEGASQAFGIFTARPSIKNFWTNHHSLREYYALAADDETLYLITLVGTRDEIHSICETLKQGVDVGPEQSFPFDWIDPVPGARFTVGDSPRFLLQGPGIGLGLNTECFAPGGAGVPLSVLSASAGSVAYSISTLTDQGPFGTWTLRATQGPVVRETTFEVLPNDHPRGVVTRAELDAARARWTTDPRYTTEIRSALQSRVAQAYAEGPAPAQPDSGPKYHSADVANYASYLLMNPTASQYRARMWSDFATILSWPNWDVYATQADYFVNDSVERGEMIMDLLLAYDFHYNDLTPSQARAFADRLAVCLDRLLDMGYAGVSAPRWNTAIWIQNNKYMLQNAAIGLGARVLEPLLPATRTERWRQRSDVNFASVAAAFPPDGSAHEGYSYGVRATSAMVVWTETRRVAGHPDVYASTPWFSQAPMFDLYGLIPGRMGNYGGILPMGNTDPEPYGSHRMTMGLIGSRTNDPFAQWIAENSDWNHVGTLDPIWRDFSRNAAPPSQLPNWHAFADRGLFVFRSDWSNDAMYLAAICGPTVGGHQHPDQGTFTLYKDGYPYIAQTHYLRGHTIDDQNIVQVNGRTLRGQSPDGFAFPEHPDHAGRIRRALGSPDAFFVAMNPQPAYEAEANLSAYTREFVGFDDVVFLRDKLNTDGAGQFVHPLHGYRTDKQTHPNIAYDPYQHPTDEIFASVSPSITRLTPNTADTACVPLYIHDVSRSNWSRAFEPWIYVPGTQPGAIAPGGVRPPNNRRNLYQNGRQLVRRINGVAEADSLLVMHFRGAALNVRRWDTGVAEAGAVVSVPIGASSFTWLKVVWPRNGQLTFSTQSEGLTTYGTMAMRNYQTGMYGGRDLTYLRDDSALGEHVDLVAAQAPVSVISNLARGREAWIACDQPTGMLLHHPAEVSTVYINGQSVPFVRQGQSIGFYAPASPGGAQLTTSNSTAVTPAWTDYR